MKRIFLLLLIPCFLLLTGCASIISGTHQKVALNTNPESGARCDLSNDKGKWAVTTPGTIKIHRSSTALSVLCRKKGYEKASKAVKSHIKGTVGGNFIFGGIIGAGIDAADGAAFYYPEHIVVDMTRSKKPKKT